MLACQKNRFDITEGVHYLNGAAYSPQLKSALSIGEDAIRFKMQRPYQISSSYHFETANLVRKGFSRMINAGDDQSIAIIPAVSYGLATVAHNLHRLPGIATKKNIVMVQDEFPDSLYAFQRACEAFGLSITTVKMDKTAPDFARQWNEDLLTAITPDTALVICQHVHWMYGVKFDLVEIGRQCRSSGALFVVDGSQSVGVLPFDIQEIQPDALVVATYKWMFGIYGAALAYFGPFFDEGIPIEENWMNRANSLDFTRLTQYTREYLPKAQRYNTGEFSQFFQLPVLKDAIDTINDWGVGELQDYSFRMAAPYLKRLEAAGCVFAGTQYRAAHLTGIRLPENINLANLMNNLKTKQVHVSLRGDIVRLSVHIYTEEEDLERFCESVIIS